MGRPKYGWWGYVKDMIRRYPSLKEEYADLHTQAVTPSYAGLPGGGSASRVMELISCRELPSNKQREYEAVRRAIITTERMVAGRDRLRIVELVFWKRTLTLRGAARMIPCSYDTAQRYHSDFIKAVAAHYGFLDL